MHQAKKSIDESGTSRTLTARQCRAARAWLGWSREALAEASGVSWRAIANLEDEKRESKPRTVAALIKALSRDGVRLLPGGSLELQQIDRGKSVAQKP